MTRIIVYAFLFWSTISNSNANQTITLEDVVRNVINSNVENDKKQTIVERSHAATQQVSAECDWNLAAEGGVHRPRVPQATDEGYLTNRSEFNYV